jgi:hypothetical protein
VDVLVLSYLSLVLDSLSLIIDFSFVAELPDDVCGYCVFHGAAGWSHFAQFTIAVVNKDPKKSKYSGNAAVQEYSREYLWVVVNDVEDGTELVFEGFIGQCIKSYSGGLVYFSSYFGSNGLSLPMKTPDSIFLLYDSTHVY